MVQHINKICFDVFQELVTNLILSSDKFFSNLKIVGGPREFHRSFPTPVLVYPVHEKLMTWFMPRVHCHIVGDVK